MTEQDREWAQKSIRMGYKVLAALVGAFTGLAFVRWLGWW